MERIIRLPSFQRVETAMFKILVEEGHLDLYRVPRDVFKTYWGMRLELTERALENLERSSDLGDAEGYTPVLEVALELELSPNTISQMISRKILQGRHIGDVLYLKDDQMDALRQIYKKKGASKYNAH